MNAQTLYETDFTSWVDEQISLLTESRFAEIDISHLIEELKDMSKKYEHELISRFIILIAHLLKWQYQPIMQGNSWLSSIIEQRTQIEYLLEDTPSLKNKIADAIKKAYPKSVKIAVKETGLNPAIFPQICTYTQQQLLDENFYP
jgi:hypothetical protein